MHTWWKIVIGLLAIGIIAISVFNVFVIKIFSQEPIVLTASVTNSPIKYGDDIILAYSGHRNRLCRVDSDRFIFRANDMILVRRERLPSGWEDLGEISGFSTIPTVQLGSNLTPGDYAMRTFLHSDCGYRLFTVEVPEVRFKVAP